MIDEQRADPFSREEQTGDELLKRSLIYERAKSRIEEAAQKVARDRKAHIETIAVTGEDFDASYDVAISELNGLKNQLGAKADALWKQMEEVMPKFGPGLERLANAVLAKAAYDYETALCGGFVDNAAEIHLIEKFAEGRASIFTTTDFLGILKKIRRVYSDDWIPLVKSVHKELRDEGKPKYKIKCPLCGGGLYYVHSRGPDDIVRCTTCGLFYLVKEKKGAAKRDK